MSKRIKGKDWSPDISFNLNIQLPSDLKLKINKGELSNPHSNNNNKSEYIKKIISAQKQIFPGKWIITKIWTYKTPLSESQFTSAIFHHRYVVIQIQNEKKQKIFCSLEKNGQRIWIVVHKDFETARDYFVKQDVSNYTIVIRYTIQYWKPIQMKEYQVSCGYLRLIQWMLVTDLNLKKYNLLTSNCQGFCNEVEKFVRAQKDRYFQSQNKDLQTKW